MEYCKTSDLKALIPWELGISRLERMTGIDARQWCKIKQLETYQSTEQFADRVLSALGVPHLYHTLEFTTEKKTNGHGVWGYHKGCRCGICKLAKANKASRYRQKKRHAKIAA